MSGMGRSGPQNVRFRLGDSGGRGVTYEKCISTLWGNCRPMALSVSLRVQMSGSTDVWVVQFEIERRIRCKATVMHRHA